VQIRPPSWIFKVGCFWHSTVIVVWLKKRKEGRREEREGKGKECGKGRDWRDWRNGRGGEGGVGLEREMEVGGEWSRNGREEREGEKVWDRREGERGGVFWSYKHSPTVWLTCSLRTYTNAQSNENSIHHNSQLLIDLFTSTRPFWFELQSSQPTRHQDTYMQDFWTEWQRFYY